jgi:hypothetical protein
LIAALEADQVVPEPSKETDDLVKALFKALSTKGPKAGSVSFQPTIED